MLELHVTNENEIHFLPIWLLYIDVKHKGKNPVELNTQKLTSIIYLVWE